MKIRGERYAACGILGLAVSISASAQDAISFLNEANTQIRSAGSIIYQVVIAVLAIVAFLILIILILTLAGRKRSKRR